jgi:O-antigen/teichoic acid export membrane protein
MNHANHQDQIQGGLAHRTLGGSFWVYFSKITQQGISLLQITILARLLSPKDFGLMGIALLASQAIGVFMYTGYEFALVQLPDLNAEHIHTAWSVMFLRKVLIGFTLALLSWPISLFYRTPEAMPILLAMAVIQMLSGFVSPSIFLLQREMRFRQTFEYFFWSSLAGFISGILAGYWLKNVWALVIALLSSSIVQIIISYFQYPFQPHWRIDRQSLKPLTYYGRWMLGSAILWFLFSQGSTAVSGWMFSVTTLGMYIMAGRFALLPSTQLGETFIGSLLPAYAKIQQNSERLHSGFLRVLQLSAIILFSVTSFIALGLPRVFSVILGGKWNVAASLIPMLSVAGCLMALLRIGSPLYLGTGKPHFQFYLDLVQTIVMIILLYPLGRWLGLVGLPTAMLLGSIAAIPIWVWGIVKITHSTLYEVFRALLPAFLVAAVIVFILGGGQLFTFKSQASIWSVLWFFFLICISLFVLVVVLWKLQRLSILGVSNQEFKVIIGKFNDVWSTLVNKIKQRK